MLVASPGAIQADSEDLVIIEDPALSALIHKKLNIAESDSISKEAILSLKSISNAGWLGIESLNGLEQAVNLTELYLGDNKINDITPIAGFWME
jgi:Leucine-rich repeat (LRR) protein